MPRSGSGQRRVPTRARARMPGTAAGTGVEQPGCRSIATPAPAPRSRRGSGFGGGRDVASAVWTIRP